jgi:diacylglycerol kinase family enzyme
VEYIQTDQLKIENLSGVTLNVDFDGEQLMSGFPLDISMIKSGVTIVVPSLAQAAQE